MTLVEMMVAMSVFALVAIGLIFTQLFGLQYDQLVQSKLGSSEGARRGFNKLTSDIRSAKMWAIGNYNNGTFAACGNATNQVGNALKISYSTDTNNWGSCVVYYYDTNSYPTNWQLFRTTNSASPSQSIAQSLTNVTGVSTLFYAQRYNGTQVTNISQSDIAQDLEYKFVIGTTLEFAQYQYPLTRVGPGYYYNYYRMQFKIVSHCPN